MLWWLFSNKLQTSNEEQPGQNVRHIPFDECAFGSNDDWSRETNRIAGHRSGYELKEEESGCSFLFIRWVLVIRAVVESAATESLSLVSMYRRQHSGKCGECWNSRAMQQQKNNQWCFQSSIERSVHRKKSQRMSITSLLSNDYCYSRDYLH